MAVVIKDNYPVTKHHTLIITNSAYREKQKVTFKNTYPIALSGLQFSSILTDSDVQLATVTLNFETYEFELI